MLFDSNWFLFHFLSQGVFVPVLPLFDKKTKVKLIEGSGVVPLDYINPFLDEQARSLEERYKEATKVFDCRCKLVFSSRALYRR